MGHSKWSEIRRPYVVWTGDNVEEVEAFACKHGFMFGVGSPIHCSLPHDHFDWNDDDPCEEDESVLEIYKLSKWEPRWRRFLQPWRRWGPSTWTHADPGDTILPYGRVVRTSEDNK